jgi:hypothetical protein
VVSEEGEKGKEELTTAVSLKIVRWAWVETGLLVEADQHLSEMVGLPMPAIASSRVSRIKSLPQSSLPEVSEVRGDTTRERRELKHSQQL